MQSFLVYSSALLGFAGLSIAQTFSDLPLGLAYPKISTTCAQALNTTVSCPGFLGIVSSDQQRLKPEQLSALCVSSCQTSLSNVRQTIINACTGPDDSVEFDNRLYPATYVVEHFIKTYNVACRKDAATNEYCDTIALGWISQGIESTKNCEDCLLGSMQEELKSPVGYNEDFASYFSSLTSECNSNGYSYTTPTSYVLNETVTPTSALPTPTCVGTHTITNTDNCSSVALAHNISTYDIQYLNNIIDCDNITDVTNNKTVGGSLCYRDSCSLHKVTSDDTCASIVATGNGAFSLPQFQSWNPSIQLGCSNLWELVGEYLCVSPPGGGSLPRDPQATVTAMPSSPPSPVPKPSNAPTGSNPNCARWYTIQDGDTCTEVSIYFGITVNDFYFLNSDLNAECTNLWLGSAYCVQAVGAVTTYSGYPTPNTTAYYSLTSNTYTTTTYTETSWEYAPEPTEIILARASGTLTNCTIYRNYVSPPNNTDQADELNEEFDATYSNQCTYLANYYGFQVEDLIAWNPSLNPNNCTMQPGKSYCVQAYDPPEIALDHDDYCMGVEPEWIVSGTNASCSCYGTVWHTDNEVYGCDMLELDWHTPLTSILAWNPWLGSESTCTENLYANLTTDWRAFCIGVNQTVPTSTVSMGTSASSTTSNSPPGPTVGGMAPGCSELYTVQSGDYCAAICAQFSISFSQFLSWNPAIGSNCENLWLGYSYCVGVPPASSTSEPPPTSTPPPLREGTPTDCTTYHLVVSGDSCGAIQSQYSITFTQLYGWNPSIGSNCESLWLGYGVCVAR